jgi:hypothetical protein
MWTDVQTGVQISVDTVDMQTGDVISVLHRFSVPTFFSHSLILDFSM